MLEGVRLEVTAGRPAAARARTRFSKYELEHVKSQRNQVIKGRATATLLLNQEDKLRKEDAGRHLVKLEELRLDATLRSILIGLRFLARSRHH